MSIYLLPDDLGEFLFVLKNGPDEESLQGVPSNEGHVLGGQGESLWSVYGCTTLMMELGQDTSEESPVLEKPCGFESEPMTHVLA